MKGFCTVQLKDEKTGRIFERTEENMVTNAVKNLLNPPPCFFAAGGDYTRFLKGNTPIAKTLLGGVMLWSEPLVEDVDNIMPPSESKLIGFAGDEAYSGLEARKGSYNQTESGATETGYRHVWDFTTNQGNGTIRAISLTSAFGGRGGLCGVIDSNDYVFKAVDFGQEKGLTISGNCKMVQFNGGLFSFMGMSGANKYCVAEWITTKQIKIKEYQLITYNFKLSSDAVKPKLLGEWTINLVNADFNQQQNLWYRDGDFFVQSWFDGYYKKLHCVKINVITKAIAEDKIIVTSPQVYSIPQCVEESGYFYSASDRAGIIHKINKSTGVVTSISLGVDFTSGQVASFFKLNGNVYFENTVLQFLINVDKPIKTNMIKTYFIYSNKTHIDEFVNKPYVIRSEMAWDANKPGVNIFPLIYAPYIGTIDNLSTPVTKTASQTMKIIYTLTDV